MDNSITLDKQNMVQAIKDGYGIEITNLEFLLRGFGGDCFRANSTGGTCYFLKLHDPVANQMTAASSRAFYLPLMHQLHTKEILTQIPHPMPTKDGGLSLRIGSNELVITNFIEGGLVGFDGLPEPILARLAEMVGVLHRSTAELEFEFPFINGFEIVFEKDLLRSFDTLSRLPEDITPGQKSLRDIILPRKEQIIADLGILKELQSFARNTCKTKVICHTDLHGGNLMTDEDGTLYILDWENAMIAPPEHDIFFLLGKTVFGRSSGLTTPTSSLQPASILNCCVSIFTAAPWRMSLISFSASCAGKTVQLEINRKSIG
jgi:Ser/Thr protein kinase RdoA (MazF antagonist)